MGALKKIKNTLGRPCHLPYALQTGSNFYLKSRQLSNDQIGERPSAPEVVDFSTKFLIRYQKTQKLRRSETGNF